MTVLFCDLAWPGQAALTPGEVVLKHTATGDQVSVWGAPAGYVSPGAAVIVLLMEEESEHIMAVLESGHALRLAGRLVSRLGR